MIAVVQCSIRQRRNATFGGQSEIDTATMSRAESLTLELESVRLELERLKAENARLRDEKGIPESAETEQLYQQAISDLAQKDSEIAQLRTELEEAEEQRSRVQTDLQSF